MKAYDPYTYQPLMRMFYEGTHKHQNAVADFNRWLGNSFPAVKSAVAVKKPALLDPGGVVESGKISPRNGMAGMGQEYEYEIGAETSTPSIFSEWGRDILDISKGVLAAKTQQDLIKLNIARAEQGLAPIDVTAMSPQVNVGVSKQVQTMLMVGVGVAAIIGLLAVAKR